MNLKFTEQGVHVGFDKPEPPKVICMCGSTRFADLMAVISWEFEKMGYIVLRVNYVPQWYVDKAGLSENGHLAEQQGLKAQLDELHCRKIDLSDLVFVCNYNNYIGESTKAEMEYAKKVDRQIIFMEHDEHELNVIANKMARWWTDAR